MFQNASPAVLAELSDKDLLLHPLHVAVSAAAIQRWNQEIEKGEFTGVLLPESDSFYKNVFVTVHTLDMTREEDDNPTVIRVYVAASFLNHYGYNFGDLFSFKLINCFPIQKVVFGTRTSAANDWTKTENWRRDFLHLVSGRKTLCRLNDVFLASPDAFSLSDASLLLDMLAIQMSPVDQGVLTLNTTVVIIDMRDTIPPYHYLSMVECDNSVREDEIFGESGVVSDENCRLEGIEHSTKNLLESECDDGNSKKYGTSKFVFRARVIPVFDSVFHQVLQETDAVFDPLNTVFIGCGVMRRLQLETGQWVKVEKIDHCKCRFATVCSLPNAAGTVSATDDTEDDDVVYVSPHLWFNLNNHPSKLIQSNSQITIEICTDESPPYADEAFVSLVQSPCYNGTISCETVLKKYFRNTRYICKGDIFCVDSKGAVNFHYKNQDADNMNWPMVYFRVSVCEGPPSDGYLINRENTRLYQAGTSQSYIPMAMEAFYSSFTDTEYFYSPEPPGLSSYVDVLEEIITPLLSFSNRTLQISSNILLMGGSGCGKTVVVRAVCQRLNLHLYQVNCHELLGESSGSIEAKLKMIMEKTSVYSPCITLLRNIDCIGREKELKGENSRVLGNLSEMLRTIVANEWPSIVVATTMDLSLLGDDLSSAFLHHIHMEPPTGFQRSAIIESLVHPNTVDPDVDYDYMGQRTAGFLLSDLNALVKEAMKNRYCRVKSLIASDTETEEDLSLAGIPLTQTDLLQALEKLQSAFAEVTGAPKIPNVFWEDVGGLSHAKEEILNTIQLPVDHPEILSSGLRRSGVLLYGPPGTGKTLIAKAVATECSLNFFSVKGPELINMYVGQSEGNVRSVFQQARAAVPCIIFFDELDSLAPNRGGSADSGGVMDRVVSQLLSEMDGLSNSAQVFVIGATNRPDLIDPALLRPGRFDRLVYIGVPEDKESKLSILKALTRKMQVSADVDLEEIVEKAPKSVSGADFYSLCADAMMHRVKLNVELIENGAIDVKDANCEIQREDFLAALEKLMPSIRNEDLLYYEKRKHAL